MAYEIDRNALFINPYNFLKSDFKHKSRADISNAMKEKMFTGKLDCSLYVKTPLAILDTENVDEDSNGHKTYKFFSTDGITPVIPGSSLRGMMRSMYEAATNSCYSTGNVDEYPTFRNSPRNAYKACILKITDGKYTLYEAERYLISGRIELNEGKKRLIFKGT